MRCDQNGFIGRTDLGCDDLPPIEARRPDVSLLWPVAARKKSSFLPLARLFWLTLNGFIECRSGARGPEKS